MAYAKLSDLSVQMPEGAWRRIVVRLRDAVGRKTRFLEVDGLRHRAAPVLENALLGAIRDFAPDVVIVSSVDRWAWRRISDACNAQRIPTILYIREESSLKHLATGALPTRLVANTPSLAHRLRADGHRCDFIPSVVDLTRVSGETSRTTALAINPTFIKGADVIWRLAEMLPSIPFVLQEAWPLDPAERAKVAQRCDQLSNVEFRHAQPPGPDLYSDARVLLAPYRVDSRPRVVLEAQANGIPVLGSDLPALVEAIGLGGLTMPVANTGPWVDALQRLWDDDGYYASLVAAARLHGQRPEVSAPVVTDLIEALLTELAS
ncbi:MULTISPECIES: glycosyltransferase [unclassified Knoellia]|uniref:glycosyltransferase n=1 Tax=Knoellia altitudinis TaxID=3404795 RepID=UPI003609E5A8